MADGPETRLDRIARDLSRTLLHGSRVTDNAGHIRPATIATAQQIRVDLPASGPMNFEFSVGGGAPTPVLISRADAIESQTFMTDALGTDRAKYLTLATDSSLPTWVFGQRSFSFPNPLPAEDTIGVTVPDAATPGATRKLTLVKLPTSARAEVSPTGDSYVALTRFDAAGNRMVPLAHSGWQPAIMLRFKIKLAPPAPGLPAGAQIFELQGTPQGDRYFLDRLGLLDAFLSATADPNPPDIEAVALALSHTPSGTPSAIAEWTIIRTNLTREARSGENALSIASAAAAPSLPFVAISGGDADQDKDAVRLLQMISITNSGGYFLRTATAPAQADTLVLSIVLKARPDPDSKHEESTWLPRAANAVALAGAAAAAPDAIRFNGLDHVEIAPAVPPGNVLFGWTRTEPDSPTTLEDKFGYGTISLVDYAAIDGAGQQVGIYSADTVVAISPSQPLDGEPFERMSPLAASGVIGAHHLHTGVVAALGLRNGAAKGVLTAAAVGTVVRHFRASLQCYNEKTQSPYARIADQARSQVTLTPGFRDVFGNRFDAAAAPPVRRRLFYTDPLIAPAEWPGIRFAAYPGKQGGSPYLYLEMQYRFLDPKEKKDARIKRLNEICTQLVGANADVSATFSAEPIVKGDVSLSIDVIVDQIGKWIDQENANHTADREVLVKALMPVACNGTVDDIKQCEPRLSIKRTNGGYGPADADLPDNAVLAKQIKAQVLEASSAVYLQAATAKVTAGTARKNDEFREVAQAFQDNVTAALKMQVGFLRDRLNQHELWCVPKAFFPTAPSAASYAGWSFATARPLSNKLSTENFTVPNFAATCTGSGPDCWHNHPIVAQAAIDQDLDELGRVAFRLVEQESTALAAMTDRSKAAAARQLLSEREQIALTLTSFQGDGGPGYLVPLYDKPDGVDEAGVVRACKDEFLTDLNAFYSTDTVMQLPLTAAGSSKILTFEGKVAATFAAGSPAPRPALSNVLIGGGDQKVTVLYDLPPGTRDVDAVARLDTVTARIHHVQLPLADGAPADKNLFNQGPWLELVEPQQLAWKGPADSIPAADRRFPAKPVIKATETLLPWLNAPPPKITASNAALLVRWGWRFVFGLVEPSSNDIVHLTVRYNEPPTGGATDVVLMAVAAEWRPQSLLNSLFALKLLKDNLALVSEPERLQIVADLASFLRQTLSAGGAMRALAAAARPQDHFTIKWHQTTPGADAGGRAIMQGPIAIAWSGADAATATVSALADATGNNALLTGTAPVRNYRAALRLLRNEHFGPVSVNAANPSLVYECAPVESPLECWARNTWSGLVFDRADHSLQQALKDFFASLLAGTNLSAIDIEVGAALKWQSGRLDAVTPFSILPTDIKPTGRGGASTAADALAAFVHDKCTALLGTSIPPDVIPMLRLRVKLATLDTDASRRTLLDLNAIDFPL
jgi:hypothetical protein